MAKLTLEDVQRKCDFALQDLERFFKPHCRLTLVMRNPESSDGDMVLTGDELSEVVRAIQRLQDRDQVKPKFWSSPRGALMCDTAIEGVTQWLPAYYDGNFFVCEAASASAAKKIAEALGGEFVEDKP